jgi:hypothetical protein
MVLLLVLNAIAWGSGYRGSALASAVEQGAARVESWNVGVEDDDAIRKAIDLQQESLTFWATLSAIGDFLFAPCWLAGRCLMTAVLLSGAAAMVGRPVRFEAALASCAAAQGIWVLGRGVQVGLMLALGRSSVETSATLMLSAEGPSAPLWLALEQLDAFALLGWVAMARGGWKRGQANLLVAATLCAALWMIEACVRVGWALLVGAGMRMTLLPG